MEMHPLGLPSSRQRLIQKGQAYSFPTDGSSFWLGSAEDCHIRCQGLDVAEHHLEGQWREQALWLRDHSQGQTRLNGKPLAKEDWTPFPPRGHLQLSQDQSSFSLGIGQSEQKKPEEGQPLKITFWGDATCRVIAQAVTGQPKALERMAANGKAKIQVKATLARQSKWFQSLWPAVIGALAGGGLWAAGLQNPIGLVAAPLPVWLGVGVSSRRFQEEDPTLDCQNWKHVDLKVVKSHPDPELFRESWQESLSSWPQARHLVYLSGHGNQRGAAELPYHYVGSVVQGAEVMLLDACNGAQLESLARLKNSAQVVVASEHQVASRGLPLGPMLAQEQVPGGARELGQALVHGAAQANPADSLVAVDLEALQSKLLPSLDKLGGELNLLSVTGQRPAVEKALNSAETTDANKVDLGSFLQQLQGLDPQIEALEECSQAFDETIVAMAGHGTLSFDRIPSKELPLGWRQFLLAHPPT